MKKYQKRDIANGQYTYDGNWNRICVCGHTLGVHSAVTDHGERDCLMHSIVNCPEPDKSCRCTKFRQTRRKYTPEEIEKIVKREKEIWSN